MNRDADNLIAMAYELKAEAAIKRGQGKNSEAIELDQRAQDLLKEAYTIQEEGNDETK